MRGSFVSAWLLVVSSVIVAGCGGGSATSLCSDVCECTGCSEEEEQDCVDDVEDQQKDAEDEGCAEQADELLSCYGDQLECRDGDVDLDGCDSEEESLANCVGSRSTVDPGGEPGGGPEGNVCDRAVYICLNEDEPANIPAAADDEEEPECSGTFECEAYCVDDAATCDGNDDDLLSCLSDCGGSSPAPED